MDRPASCKLQTSRIYVTFLLSLKISFVQDIYARISDKIFFLSFSLFFILFSTALTTVITPFTPNCKSGEQIEKDREENLPAKYRQKESEKIFSISTLINMSRSTDHLHTFCIITLHKRCEN